MFFVHCWRTYEILLNTIPMFLLVAVAFGQTPCDYYSSESSSDLLMMLECGCPAIADVLVIATTGFADV